MLHEDDAEEDVEGILSEDEVDPEQDDAEPAAELDDELELDSIIAGAGREAGSASAPGAPLNIIIEAR